MYFLIAVLALVVLAWTVWVILARMSRRQRHDSPALDSGKLVAFHSALERFEWQLNPEALSDLDTSVLPKFDNPYVAAMDAWVAVMRRFAQPTESYSLPTAVAVQQDAVPATKAFGFETVCDFVNEKVVSHDEGKRYFQEILAAAQALHPDDPELSGNTIDFDALLNRRRAAR